MLPAPGEYDTALLRCRAIIRRTLKNRHFRPCNIRLTCISPYSNAETSGGGLALWGSDGSLGNLRTSDETYHQAWIPWVQEIGSIIAANQITNGGPVILNQVENELTESVHSADNTLVIYMEQLKKAFRDAGIVVPFTSNEKGMRGQSWSTDYQDVGGSVNVYGLDSYPGGQSCTNPSTGFKVVRTYYQCKLKQNGFLLCHHGDGADHIHRVPEL